MGLNSLSPTYLTHKSLKRVQIEVCKILHAPAPQTSVAWADEHFYLSPESSSVQGPWVTLPYQKAILLTMTNDDVRTVSMIKSARVGYTKLLCVATAYLIAHRRRNGVIYQPTDSDASDFVADEINTTLRDVPAIGELLLCAPDKLSRYNTTSKKTFTGAVLDIKGGKSARNYRRLTKDFVIYDELDGFDTDIDHEGSPLSLGDTRVETSSYPKSIRGSTPRVKGTSMIEECVSDSDMHFTRHLPCPHCEHLHPLEWKNLHYINKDPTTTKFVCPECEGSIDFNQYREMDGLGQWLTEDGIHLDDETGRFWKDGQLVEPPFSASFHVWSAYSYFSTWKDIVKEFLFAMVEVKRGNNQRLKSFTNVRRGEVWVEEGETADENLLKLHRESYRAEVPGEVKVLTAAVDVQDDRFEIEICGWALGEECFSLRYIQLYGNLAKPEIWNILEEILVDTYEGENGDLHNIALTCIDSGGHFTSEVYTFCRRNYRRYIPIKGHAQAGQPIAKMPTKVNGHKVYLTMIGTDTAKSLIYSRYKLSERGPGYCHYPATDEYDDEYFAMATAETKIKRYKKGVEYYEWQKENSQRNEALDCRVYNLAAVRLLQQHYGVKLKEKLVISETKPTPPEKEVVIAKETINSARKKRNRRPKGGFTQGWRK
jgi:phage terminase large subunit GpA-like protein